MWDMEVRKSDDPMAGSIRKPCRVAKGRPLSGGHFGLATAAHGGGRVFQDCDFFEVAETALLLWPWAKPLSAGQDDVV